MSASELELRLRAPGSSGGVARRERLRWLLAPLLSIAIVIGLLLLMEWMIRAPEGKGHAEDDTPAVEMVRVQPQKPQAEQQAAPQSLPAAAPPPPPAAPPSLARAEMPTVNAPAIAITAPTVDIAVPTSGSPQGSGTGLSLGSGLTGSGAFGGFAGNGGGNGNGGPGGSGNGFATGNGGFSGKPLVPLSTARPQMPAWACKQKIKGWVEVVFTVLPTGKVQDVKIVDAQPRGVYEAAAIESVSNWLYDRSKQAQEVKQRVEMDPEDCQYNWQ